MKPWRHFARALSNLFFQNIFLIEKERDFLKNNQYLMFDGARDVNSQSSVDSFLIESKTHSLRKHHNELHSDVIKYTCVGSIKLYCGVLWVTCVGSIKLYCCVLWVTCSGWCVYACAPLQTSFANFRWRENWSGKQWLRWMIIIF